VKAIRLSNPGLILTNSDRTAKLPFITEPSHTWCYYYTKAELARQQHHWEQVVHLFYEAKSLAYKANDPFELLVFIEGQAMTGNVETAEKLSQEAMNADKGIRKGLCQVWKRVQTQSPARDGTATQIDKILIELQCAR
jgi:hypothetical protein